MPFAVQGVVGAVDDWEVLERMKNKHDPRRSDSIGLVVDHAKGIGPDWPIFVTGDLSPNIRILTALPESELRADFDYVTEKLVPVHQVSQRVQAAVGELTRARVRIQSDLGEAINPLAQTAIDYGILPAVARFRLERQVRERFKKEHIIFDPASGKGKSWMTGLGLVEPKDLELGIDVTALQYRAYKVRTLADGLVEITRHGSTRIVDYTGDDINIVREDLDPGEKIGVSPQLIWARNKRTGERLGGQIDLPPQVPKNPRFNRRAGNLLALALSPDARDHLPGSIKLRKNGPTQEIQEAQIVVFGDWTRDKGFLRGKFIKDVERTTSLVKPPQLTPDSIRHNFGQLLISARRNALKPLTVAIFSGMVLAGSVYNYREEDARLGEKIEAARSQEISPEEKSSVGSELVRIGLEDNIPSEDPRLLASRLRRYFGSIQSEQYSRDLEHEADKRKSKSVAIAMLSTLVALGLGCVGWANKRNVWRV